MTETERPLRGKIQTVLGPIEPEALGPTLMHEHILCDIRWPAWRGRGEDLEITLENRWEIDYGEVDSPGNLILQDVQAAIKEMQRLRLDGGRTVVDLSCGGLKPDPLGLQQVSKAADVHIVMGCGHYVEDYQDPANATRSVDDFAVEMIAQIREGAWSTSVRAGIIGEIGCQVPWTPLERRVMTAAVIAQAETGASLSVHPGRHPDQPQEVADFLRREKADMSRVIISHIDRTIFDEDRMFRLADSGCVLEFDLFGMESSYYKWSLDVDMPNDAMRLRWIRRLIDRGHLERVLISQDICYRTRFNQFGGHGYGHIFRNIVPLMRRRGFSEAEIEMLLVGNPRRLLTFV